MMMRHTKSLLVALFVLVVTVSGGCFYRYWRVPSTESPAPGSSSRPAAAPRFAVLPAHLHLLSGDGVAGLRNGADARFSDPWGVVVTSGGSIIVADAGDNDRIRIIDSLGHAAVFAGAGSGYVDGPANIARFDTPSGLARDEEGNIYVADTGNDAIRKIAPDGGVTTLAGGRGPGRDDGRALDARFDAPIGVAVDGTGNVYVADTYNHRIRRIGIDGLVTTVAGGLPGFQDGPGAQARFDTPCAVAADADGSLWVADTRNRAIRHIAADGTVTTLARSEQNDYQAPLRRPIAIVADAEAIYVAEASHGRVLRYDREGGMTMVTTGDDGSQRLWRATGVALASRGLIVSDADAARVYKIDNTPAPPAPIGPSPKAPLPATHGRWPSAPQDAWHEIVGVAGEVRGNGKGESRDHLHLGVDVRADVGAKVFAIADGKISDPLAAWGYGTTAEGLTIGSLDYIHLRVGRDANGSPLDPERLRLRPGKDGKAEHVEVRRGTRFRAGDVLGTTNAMAHTHLQFSGNARFRNPIDLGFAGFVDNIAPVIDKVELRDATGASIAPGHDGIALKRTDGPFGIVVEAWDQVDGNLARRKLGLYAVGYQLFGEDGLPVAGFESPKMNLVFDRLPMDDAATRVIYASDSGVAVHGSASTRFLYAATNVLRDGVASEGRWDVSSLAPGRYTLHIIAEDRSGNRATRNASIPIVVR